jgi:hypothetical protein
MNVLVVHASGSNVYKVEEIALSNIDLLRGHPSETPMGTLRGSLYLCEDTSSEFIEVLGGKLDVDPAIIATYLFTLDRSMAKEAKVARNLPSRHATSHTFSLKYHEVRDLPSDGPTVQICRLVAPGNITRGVSTWEHWVGFEKSITGAIRRNMAG